MSKIRVFGHFLGNRSLKISNFLHDGRGQLGASFEYGAIFGKNLYRSLIVVCHVVVCHVRNVWKAYLDFHTC